MKVKIQSFPDDDLYYDCDYILKQGKQTDCVKIDDVLYIDDRQELLNENDIKAIKAFYIDDDFKRLKANGIFKELSAWPFDIKASLKRMNNTLLAIKYRGGRGYHYGWWVLNE